MSAVVHSEEAPRASARGAASKKSASERLARRLGLRLVGPEELTIARRRRGRGFIFQRADGSPIQDRALIRRLNRLAVPPAYADALYAPDACAHLQAIWCDAAGRRQYRYHPDWDKVRDDRRLRRLSRLSKSLPRLRRAMTRQLARRHPTREFALAALIELVSISSIRAGRESYARANGTRGAATLLKSNVAVSGRSVTLSFRAKGGKAFRNTLSAPRLAGAVKTLRTLPGRRLFQYRDARGDVRELRASEVNAFLRETAGVGISLKDFRTLNASTVVLDLLARTPPAQSERGRRKQVLAAIQAAADKLGNTPAICRRSYVPAGLVAAFEQGRLQRLAARERGTGARQRLLADVLAGIAPPTVSRSRRDLRTQLERSVAESRPNKEN
jgi:DNA topoisomerase-1